MRKNKKLKVFINWVRVSVWAFPAFLVVVLIILTACKISGTSSGTYHQNFYGSTSKDPDLLFGSPKAIRSDEWLVGTQLIISQSRQGFPRVNMDLGAGQDLSLQTE